MRFVIFLLLSITCSAQQADNWYFGVNQGLHFGTGAPVLVTGALNTTEGVASISDAGGQLLLYTNGINVYNRLHAQMPNGFGLLGDQSSTQSAVIVPRPLSPNLFYIFTADADAGTDGIQYSVVDMTLSAGLGDVTTKNVALYTPSCEKLTAVRHCNNRDVWVISHDWGSNTFRCWLVSPLGVSAPVTSSAGYAPTGVAQNGYGQLRANSRGDRLASAYYGAPNVAAGNRVELYDFDKLTGLVSNAISLGTINGAYGVEFSPSGRMLYASTNPGALFQWDLCAASVTGSKYAVATMGAFGGSLQMAPDGRMYISRGTLLQLSRINTPETYGGGCGFQAIAVVLTAAARFGLPNFCPFYLRPRDDFIFLTACLSLTVTAPVQISCAPPVTLLWRFGDGTTSTAATATHNYTTPGIYLVELEIDHGCYTDTILNTINLTGALPVVTSTVSQ